jgi:hypothetical protein
LPDCALSAPSSNDGLLRRLLSFKLGKTPAAIITIKEKYALH